MLIEDTLFGERNKEAIAIERLRTFEPLALSMSEHGYYVADSSGKDSTVIKKLAELAGVKHEIVHSHTTADNPETVNFIVSEKKRAEQIGIIYTISYPTYKGKRTSFWKLIVTKGLPTRLQRWCCEILKEGGGNGKVAVTGVRWAESNNRKKNRGIAEILSRKKKDKSIILTNDNENERMSFETCLQKGKRIVNPIIDWLDEDVWEFIHKYDLPYNPLYDYGYKRVGCIGCPMSDNYTELEKNPKFKNMYLRAAARHLQHRKDTGKTNYGAYANIENYYNWWTEQVKKSTEIEGQLTIQELENSLNSTVEEVKSGAKA